MKAIIRDNALHSFCADDYEAVDGISTVVDVPAGTLVPTWNGTAIVEGATQQQIDDDLAAYKVKVEATIDSDEAAYRNGIFGTVDAYRVFEYMIGVMEAYSLKSADPDAADMPHIKGAAKKVNAQKALDRGTTEDDEAALVKTTFASWSEITAKTAGIRVKNKDVLLAATTKAGVDAAYGQYHADMQAYIATLV